MHNRNAITLPAGTYMVGDPCYAFAHNTTTWHDLCDQTDCFNLPGAKLKGGHVVGFSTAYGDGEYRGSDGFNYGVDAGLIGCVSKALCEGNAEYAMKEVTFDADFEVSASHGVITIGHIVIDTTDEEEDEDEYSEDEEEEDA